MKPKKVLIIDDEADLRRVSKLSLELEPDIEVEEASGGEEGIKIALELKPDAILLDAMMPEMDGYATIKKLKEDLETRDIPVIFFSARTSRAEIKAGMGLGAVGYIKKPFDPVKLAKELKELLGWEG